jgi:hypothetical protein
MLFLIVGALVATYLISRLVGLFAKRWPDSIGKAVSVNAVSAIIVVLAGAFASAADGSTPKFYLALLIYGGAQLIVLTFDLFRIVRFKPSADSR